MDRLPVGMPVSPLSSSLLLSSLWFCDALCPITFGNKGISLYLIGWLVDPGPAISASPQPLRFTAGEPPAHREFLCSPGHVF